MASPRRKRTARRHRVSATRQKHRGANRDLPRSVPRSGVPRRPSTTTQPLLLGRSETRQGLKKRPAWSHLTRPNTARTRDSLYQGRRCHGGSPRRRGLRTSLLHRHIRRIPRRTVGRAFQKCQNPTPKTASHRRDMQPTKYSPPRSLFPLYSSENLSVSSHVFEFDTLMVALFDDKLGVVGPVQLVAHIKWSVIEERDSTGSLTDRSSFYKVQHWAVFKGDDQYPESADILTDYEGTGTNKDTYVVDRGQPAGTGALAARTATSGSKRGGPSRQGHEADDDEEGDGAGEGPPGKRVRQDDSNTGSKKLLACPFFKHNPAKYANARSCVGPGWPSAHRVKFVLSQYRNCSPGTNQPNVYREHLLRRHTLPIFQCERCFVNFETRERFQEHIRQRDLCTLADPSAREAISKVQELQLRKRGKRTVSDEEKWNEMYMILFPDDIEIPSPCKGTPLLLLTAN